MKESLELKATFKVKPEVIYDAWLDSAKHSEMTGGDAVCGREIGEEFSAWDGYITGKNTALSTNSEIVQTWRTSEFAEADEDSKLVVRLRELDGGTELTLIHTNIPAGQTQYEKGWVDNYFDPMHAYFD